jgi:hypothetical protein
VELALRYGYRGLRGGSSLARLLEKERRQAAHSRAEDGRKARGRG